jgi:hypothetical protein
MSEPLLDRAGRRRSPATMPGFHAGPRTVVGPLFCIINGATHRRFWSTAAARADLRRTAAAAGLRRRFAPHQLRHAHAVEMAREGVPLIVIQRQLGHRPRHHLAYISRASTAARSSKPSTPDAPDDPGQRLAADVIHSRPCAPPRAKRHSARPRTGRPLLVQLSSDRPAEREA